MSEIKRIMDQIDRTFNGAAWHGLSLIEILEKIDPETAKIHLAEDTHNIWELLLHIISWIRFARISIEGSTLPKEIPVKTDWPPVTDSSEEAWQNTMESLHIEHTKLKDSILNISDSDLDTIVKGREYSAYVLIHGVVQHNLYHAGQISLIYTALEKKD